MKEDGGLSCPKPREEKSRGKKMFQGKIIKCAESSKEIRMKKWPLDLSDGVH